ncbi:MAG: bifunctional diaminohydroxyphosphoribosylaminopyrimidine deaminase/5-amino-6-(5-phosphoribosylamino)uracil reductase RibD [Candidatus Brocadiales bacterium]|nr:bifunctional diaminohydroxyphosphoribosylaminopyrimidine deaminase/5-amino-6-(5-phosphoribosylamino)uracil reductase RibD [Candidatus Bathyanammoxibius sp.]
MQVALELAGKGIGRVEPNPMVGAVMVKDGKVVGQGHHEYFGGPHAEVCVLEEAGSSSRGATLYVTLEPCAHHGKTSPCVERLIEAGIKRVVMATMDPNPETKSKGADKLRQAGVEIVTGVMAEEAGKLNAPFFKLMTVGLPYVTAKWAMSLDGKTATHTGDSQWISSQESREYAHKVRSQMDMMVVGIGTVLRDDPLLTCRHHEGGRNPKRLVMDTRARLPLDSKLVRTVSESEVVVATTHHAPAERLDKLSKAGCRLMIVEGRGSKVDPVELMMLLGKEKITNILVEGGGILMASFFEEGLVDKVMAFISPKIIGGGEASMPVLGIGADKVEDALALKDVSTRVFGEDVLIEGIVPHTHKQEP